MRNKNHLSNHELAELLTERGKTSAHLPDCLACQAEVENLQQTLQALPTAAAQATAKPEEFWVRQRGAVRTLIASKQSALPQRFPALAWASALGLAILAGALLNGPTKPAPIAEAQTDPDHELLLEVERVMRSDSVSALQPASLLVQEINRNAEYDSIPRKKEIRHEN